MAGLKGFKGGGGDGLHKMGSGLVHTADSLAGGPRGTFISHYDAPGDPTKKGGTTADRGILGAAPKNLLGDFTNRGSQKKAGQ